jgi:hypothetical protein
MRLLIAAALSSHALIHLFGFAKGWCLLDLRAITGRTLFSLPEWTDKVVGLAWHFRTDEPGFVWCADVTMMRVLPISGRDSYFSGHGRMLISLGGLLPIVDAQSPQIDEGTLQRYLAEMVWFPAVALDPRIQWRAQGEPAEATLVDHGVSAVVTFHFDAEGRVQRLTAMRFKESGKNARREPWLISIHAWRELAGTLVPSAGDVRWQRKDGDLTVYKWSVDELEYNDREP